MLARRAWLSLLGLACLLPVLAACNAPEKPAPGPVVLAAASLQEALTEAAGAWTAQGHAEPVLSFAGTSALARQIEQGAPADLFVSADEEWMDTLEGKSLLRTGTRVDLMGNRLVLVTRTGGTVRALADIGQGKLALADPAAVPAGRYAEAALESLGLWQGLEDNVVPAENVRAALALVERGEAPLGVVYATDAQASDAVEVLESFPAESHPPIRYPAAVLAGSQHPDAAGFLAFLSSAEARRIFAARGFGALE